MNPVIFRILFVDFAENHYKQVSNLLSQIKTFQCQRYSWFQDNITTAIPPAGYDAYLIDRHRCGQDAAIPAFQAGNWIATLSPAPVIVLVETQEDGLAALAAGAADYLLIEELIAPVLERSLRLTITYSQQQSSEIEHPPTSQDDGKTGEKQASAVTQHTQETSQQFLETLSDIILVLIYIYDLIEQRLVYVNRDISQWLGGNSQQPLSLENFAPTADQLQEWQTVQKDQILDREIQLTDALAHHYDLHCQEILFARTHDGQPKQILGAATNITARKQAEDRRQQKQLLLEQIANGLPQLVYIYDLKTGENIYFNDQITRILGYTPQQVQQGGLDFWQNLVHVDDWYVFKQLISQRLLTLNDGEIVETEYRVKHQNGSWCYLGCKDEVFARDADGIPQQILGTAFDITQNKLINQQLTDSEVQLCSIFTNTSEGILIVDPRGIVRFANPAAAKLFNQPLEDLLEAELQWPMVVGETAELEIVQSSGQLRIGEMLVAQTQLPGESVYVVSLRDITERRQAEEALRETEQRFRQLANNIEDVFWLFTLVPLKVLYVSPAYERIWGRTCDSLYEDSLQLFEHIHPEDRENFRINLHKQGRGESTTLEYRIVRPDGEIRWIKERAFPVKNKRHKVVRVVGISEDITQEKKTKEALMNTYRQLEFHLENSPLGFIEWTEDFRVSQWSGTAEKIFGWKAEQVIHKRYDDWGFIYEDSWEIFEDILKQMMNKNQPRIIFEATNYTKNGCDIHCQWYNSILLDDQGKFLSLFSLVMDVSDRYRAELALKESEERFRAIFEQAAVGMSICTLDGRFFRVNQKLCEIVGYSREELLQRTFKDITIVRDRPENQKNMRNLLSQEMDNYSMEKRYLSKTGELVWVNVMVSLMRDMNHQPKYFIYVVENISDRKRSEIALIDSEERFRIIFEQAAVGIFKRTIEGEFVQVNQRFCEMLGYTEAELLGQNFQHFIHPEDLPIHLSYLEQILNHQLKNYQLEQRYLCKDSRDKWVKIVVSVMDKYDKKPQYLIGIVEDIQDRKITEEKLQYRLALETAVAEVSRHLATNDLVDIQGVLQTIGLVVGANRVFLNCFFDQCTKITMIDEWCDRATNSYAEKFQKVEATQFGWWMERLHKNKIILARNIDRLPSAATPEKNFLKSIGVRSVLAVPIFNGQNITKAHGKKSQPESQKNSGCNLWGTIGLNSYDVHKDWSNDDAKMLRIVGEMIYSHYSRLQVLAELRDSEALYAGIFDHSAESIFLLKSEPDGQLIYETINPTHEKIFAMSREEAIGKSLSQVRSPQFSRNFLKHFEQCLIDQKPINYQETIELEPENRHLLTTLVPIFDRTGNIVKIQGSSRDITAQKQVEAALKEAKDAADAANREKSLFLANMSHELRTPLNAILGFTQLLVRDSNITSDQQEQMNIILRSGEHLLCLINDILDFSKIEAGRITLNLESFNLFQMLDTLYDMLQIRAAAKSLDLQIIHTGDVPKYLKTDQKKLRQILINLLGNAIKFTESGRVSLHVSTRSEMPATSDRSPKNPSDPQTPDRLIFEIADTGQGIAPEELEFLFDPFVQSQSGKKSQEGTGLGLAISQQFVKLIGGEIRVQSTLGKGSIFTFEVQAQPLEPNELQNLLRQEKIAGSGIGQVVVGLAPGQPRYRILVVEDIWTSRQLLVKLLEQIGFEVREAKDGQEAVSLWRRWQPDLIFMDIRMPVMDGYQATKEIRSAVNGDSPTIIALTASAFESEKATILDTGCNDLILKPFPQSLLWEKIAFYLGVNYIYDRSLLIPATQPTVAHRKLNAQDLQVMPNEWISELHFSALSARSKQIQNLIEQIPPEYTLLIEGLTELVQHLDFDTIVSLSEVNQS